MKDRTCAELRTIRPSSAPGWLKVLRAVSLYRPSHPQEPSTSGPPLQQQVSGEIDGQRNHNEVHQQVKQAGHGVLLAKKGTTSPIDIRLRTPEIVDGNHQPS